MKIYNYLNRDIIYNSIQDLTRTTKLHKVYNRNTVLSNISVRKNFRFKGLYIFYCNKFSNLNEIYVDREPVTYVNNSKLKF